MNVYIVFYETGDYTDYCRNSEIEKVFAHRESAEEYMRANKLDKDAYYISEFEVEE